MKDMRNIPVFRDPVEDTKLSSRQPLYALKNDPHFIVRESKLDDFNRRDAPPFASAEDAAEFSRKQFTKLKQYGIDAPVHFVVAPDENKNDCVYTITDWVEPASNARLSPEERERRNDAWKTLVNQLLTYYENANINGTPFFEDIAGLDQYVYGKKEGDTENRLYLVDVDPQLTNNFERLYFNFRVLFSSFISEAERTFGLDLTDVRARYRNLVTEFEKHVRENSPGEIGSDPTKE